MQSVGESVRFQGGMHADFSSTIMTLHDSLSESTLVAPDCHPSQPPGSERGGAFKIRVANKRGIRTEASELIRRRYAQRGYELQELTERSNLFTIVAYSGSEVVGTLSVGLDSPEGLLADDLYSAEICGLRSHGLRVCEFVKFATASSTASVSTIAALYHVAFIHAHRINGCDDVVIEVNPRHVRFYKRALGFKQIGSERTNQRVNAPAVLLHCSFSYISKQIERWGGSGVSHKEEKSLYPHFLSSREETGITRRLSGAMVGHA